MKIVEEIGEAAVLEGLAEECCELAQAALKLARIYRGLNPTPVSEEEAKAMALEEFGDVNACVCALWPHTDWFNIVTVGEVATDKTSRWVERIKEAQCEEGCVITGEVVE